MKLFKNHQAANFSPSQIKIYKVECTHWNSFVQPLAYLSLRCSGSDISDSLPKPQVELQCNPGARSSPCRSSLEAPAM